VHAIHQIDKSILTSIVIRISNGRYPISLDI
jgi:hypothetical protein